MVTISPNRQFLLLTEGLSLIQLQDREHSSSLTLEHLWLLLFQEGDFSCNRYTMVKSYLCYYLKVDVEILGVLEELFIIFL